MDECLLAAKGAKSSKALLMMAVYVDSHRALAVSKALQESMHALREDLPVL